MKTASPVEIDKNQNKYNFIYNINENFHILIETQLPKNCLLEIEILSQSQNGTVG